ncbi:hypothetical protein AAG906_003272 [Vitis piasezkii]
MKQDAESYVKRCDRCQRHASSSCASSFQLDHKSFAICTMGMNIVGSLPIAATQKKFLLFATYYFSKWMETKAYASIKDKDVSKFV